MQDEETARMVREVHDYLLKPRTPGTNVTRAKQIDDLLQGVQTGKTASRWLLWVAGALVTIAAAMGVLKGWFR